MKQQLVPTPIKAMGRVITGRTPSTKNPEYYGDDYFFISPADLGGKKYVSDSIKKLSDLGIKKANKLPAQTILFTCIGSTIGKIGMSENECATNQQINAVVVDKNNFDPNYVYYQLAKHSLRIAELAGRQAVPIVNKSTFESYEINTHPLDEQKKIAQILSTWDEYIEAVEELIELHSQQMKSLRKQLFDSGYKKVKIEKIANLSGGSAFKKKFQGKKEGKYPFIKVSDFEIKGNGKYIKNSNNWIDDPSLVKCKIFRENSVVFAKVGAALLLNRRRLLTRDTAVDNNLMVATPNNSCLPEYLYHFLCTIDFSKYVQEGAVPSINQKQVGNIFIPLPDIVDQEKIVEILENKQKSIILLKRKLSLLKRQKKGLMQRLLTGKVRVN